MKIKSSDINKLKEIGLKSAGLEEENVKIVDITPTVNKDDSVNIDIDVEINRDEDLEDEEYTDDYVNDNFDLDINEIMGEAPDNLEDIDSPELLEVVIFEELDEMLMKDSHDLSELKLEIDVLNKKEEDAVLVSEIKDLQKELDKLISKFKEIAKKYDNIYETIDYANIKQLNDYYLNDLFIDYKEILQNEELWKSFGKDPKEIQEYINIVNSIIELESKKSDLKNKIDEKKEKLDIRDSEFDRLKDEYYSIDKINDYVRDFNKAQSNNLEKIKALVDKSVEVQKTIEHKREYTFNLGNALGGALLISGASFIPHNRRGNMLRIGLLITGIAALSRIITHEDKEEIEYSFDITSYEKEINNGIKGINNVIDDIDKAFLDIKVIRDKIKEELGDYINDVPEFKELLININKVEKALSVQKDIAKNYSNEFSNTLKENNEKIKKLDKYNN